MAFDYLQVFTGRRFGFDYISPAVCEGEFSSSGAPFISLLPIYRSSMTGPVMEAVGLGFHFSWATVAGALCYSVYKAVDAMDPYGPYTLIAECITDPFIDLEDAGTYKVQPITPEGAGDFSDPIVTPPGGAGAGGIPSPDHYWSMESSLLPDLISGGVRLIVGGTYPHSFTSGKVGFGMRFSGTENYAGHVSMDSDWDSGLRFPTGSSLTFAGWFNFNQTPTVTSPAIFHYLWRGDMVPGGEFTLVHRYDTGELQLRWTDIYNNFLAEISVPMPGAGWHFYRAWFDHATTKIKLQLDDGGVYETEAFVIPGDASEGRVQVFISSTTGADNPFLIEFDEMGLWFATLNSADHNFLWNNGDGKTYPF